MESYTSYTESYQALVEMTSEFLNLNVTQSKVNKLLESNNLAEAARLTSYRHLFLFLGVLIFVTNLLVVVSSGLIVKKGRQPKSTYILLGNISLADMLVGLSMIIGKFFSIGNTSNALCIFQTGLVVSSTIASIYSVGLIAVDRYIYILHGMYYRCWVSTTKVRIGILFTWIIGLVFGYIPATGWVNEDKLSTICSYTALVPGSLILLISGLNMLAITLVAIINFIILARALRKIKELKANNTKVKKIAYEKNEMKIYRGSHNFDKNPQSVMSSSNNTPTKIQSSTSLSAGCDSIDESKNIAVNVQKYKSNEDFPNVDDPQSNVGDIGNLENMKSKIGEHYDSKLSICTQISTLSEPNISVIDSEVTESKNVNYIESKKKKTFKSKEPNKWRAITVVMLTSGNLIVMWVPFIIAVTFFVFCKEKLTNPDCLDIRVYVRGPLSTMTLLSYMINPLIYAWWHKGFQRTVRIYFRRSIIEPFAKITKG